MFVEISEEPSTGGDLTKEDDEDDFQFEDNLTAAEEERFEDEFDGPYDDSDDEINPLEDDEEDNGDDSRKRSLSRQKRAQTVSATTRTVITQSESFLLESDDGTEDVFLVTTGYILDSDSKYSVFVKFYHIVPGDIELVWSKEFLSGPKFVFPTLELVYWNK